MTLLTPSPETSLADTILLTIEEGVTVYDTDFRLVAWNQKYMEMGITPREYIQHGLHIEDTYRYAAELGIFGRGAPSELARKRIEQVYAGTSPCVEDLEKTDGGIIEIRRYFLRDIGIAAVFSDVTEARSIAAKARRSEDLEILARMTGGIAHDFNNVLQAVIANLSLASLDGDKQHLAGAAAAAENGADLARRLLQLANPNPNRHADESRPFDLVAAVQSTVRWIEPMLRNNVSIQFKHQIGTAYIRANESQFSLALMNLILNSNDSMAEGGCICVTMDPASEGPGEMTRISVADSGHGMDEETVAKSNEPFFTTKGGNGTGLGLDVVRSFVKEAGGRFSLTSSLGLGTTASIWLPECKSS